MKKRIVDASMSCWDFLDKIYCINLVHRTDRRCHSEIQFARVGLNERVEYIPAKEYADNSEQGIYESHIYCIQKGLESQAQCMAIFEDDVLFDSYDPERVRQCVLFLSGLADWEVLFFGCLVSRSFATNSPAVRLVRYRSLAHAYVINRPLAEKLVKIPWSGMPFDAMLQRFVQRPYAIYPAIAFQSNARSDNSRLRWLERVRKLCGGLGFIQKVNERFHRNFRMILFFHFLAGLTIVGWVLYRMQ